MVMRYFFLFLLVFCVFVDAGAIADCGNLPTWTVLHMTKQAYFSLCGYAGLTCGILFTFLITK
jgi:hypothetical protein